MLVHHMELFHCEEPPTRNVPQYSAPCNSEEKPRALLTCRKVIAAWAMGAQVRQDNTAILYGSRSESNN